MSRQRPNLPRLRSVARWPSRIWLLLGWLTVAVFRFARSTIDRARQRYRRSTASRHSVLQKRNRTVLPSLYDRHPDARQRSRRELGIRSIPLEEIAGTAVAGYDQRGGDFLPLPPFRSSNWQGRWQRLVRATERLEVLPPIDVLQYDGTYWVEDGHNRVAAALYAGQVEIDAVVTDLRPLGVGRSEPAGSLAAVLEAGRELRDAGEGRPRRPVGNRAGEGPTHPDAQADAPA
jgi:hypothetical protein